MSDIMTYISACSVLVPVIAGIICFKYLDKNGRIMFLLMLLATIPQLSPLYFGGDAKTHDRYIIYNLYSLADPLIWGLLFFRNINNLRVKKILIVMPIIQACLWIYLTFTKGLSEGLFSELICLTSVIQVIWVTVFFYEQCSIDDSTPLEQKSLFWFCIGLLLYAPNTYFLFVFYKEVRTPELKYLWNIHSFFNICMYCVIAMGFWVNKKSKTITPDAIT